MSDALPKTQPEVGAPDPASPEAGPDAPTSSPEAEFPPPGPSVFHLKADMDALAERVRALEVANGIR